MKTKMEFLGLLFAIASIGSVHAADPNMHAMQRAMATDPEFWEPRPDLTDDEKDKLARERETIFDQVFAERMRRHEVAAAAAAQAAQKVAVKAAQKEAEAHTGLEEEPTPYAGAGESTCSTCSTLKGAALKRHCMSKHASYDQYEFKCDTCSQKFSRSDKLRSHREVNSCWQFEHFCSECRAWFASEPILNTHTERHHTSD